MSRQGTYTEGAVIGTFRVAGSCDETEGPMVMLDNKAAPAVEAEDCGEVVGTEGPCCLEVDRGRTDARDWTLLTTCTFTVLGMRTFAVVTHTPTQGPHVAGTVPLLDLVSCTGPPPALLAATVEVDAVDSAVDDVVPCSVTVELVVLRPTPKRSANFVDVSFVFDFPLPLNLTVVVFRVPSDESVSEAA